VAEPLIRVVDLRRSYALGDVTVHALRGVTIDIEAGSMVAIVGASGSGKSTLMNILGCLDTASSGRYLLDGRDVTALDARELARIRNATIGFVFQQFNLMPRIAALENVELPLLYAGVPARQRRARAREALERVGLADRMDHRPHQLSGGQQQRVAIARALVHEPRLLVCDEPTAALDAQAGQTVMELLRQVALQPNRAVIVVTHDNRVFDFGDRTITMSDGRIESVEDKAA